MSLYNLSITAIIPAFNESGRIHATIKALRSLGCIDRILVIDDGSSDDTANISMSGGAEVIRLDKNMGKANAMKKGFESATTPVILFIDADLGLTAKEAIKLLKPVCRGDAEATVARFTPSGSKGGFGLVKKLSTWGLKVMSGKTFSSVLSGQRCFKRQVLTDLSFDYPSFGIEFGMTLELLKKGTNLIEIDVDMSHRTTGRDLKGFLHRGRQFWDILKVILVKFREDKITYIDRLFRRL